MTVVEQLIDLQEVDGRIRELEHELKDLPRRKALETARLSGVSADLEAAKINLKQVNDRVKGYEADAEALREKIQQLKTAQASLSSNREYAQYSMQIDLVTHDLETTEQNWAAASEYVPSAESRLTDAQAKFDSLKGSVDVVCAELDERLASHGHRAVAAAPGPHQHLHLIDKRLCFHRVYYIILSGRRGHELRTGRIFQALYGETCFTCFALCKLSRKRQFQSHGINNAASARLL